MFGATLQRIGNRLAWRAYNRGDLDFLGRFLTDEVVYDVSGRPPVGGHWVGKAAYVESNRRWMDAHPGYRIRVVAEALTHPFALGLTNTVFTEMEVIERTAEGPARRRLAVDVSEIRRGKLVAARHYWLDPDAEAESLVKASPVRRDPEAGDRT